MSKYVKGEALPLEEFLYSHVNPVLGTFLHEKLCLTPNMITTITLLMSFVIAWCLMNNRVYLAGGLILFRQVLDSSDGFIARKYKLTSEFGAMYDKISDTVDDTLIAAVVLYKLRNVVSKYRWIFLFLFVNYLFINFAKLRRGMCIRRHNECSDPEIRHLILKNTKQFSYLEEKIMLVAGIIILYKYIK